MRSYQKFTRVDELLHRIRNSRNPITDVYCRYYWSIISHDDTPIIPAQRKQSGRAYYQLQLYIWSINHDLGIDSEKGNWVFWEGRSSDGSGRRSEPITGFHSLCFYVNSREKGKMSFGDISTFSLWNVLDSPAGYRLEKKSVKS